MAQALEKVAILVVAALSMACFPTADDPGSPDDETPLGALADESDDDDNDTDEADEAMPVPEQTNLTGHELDDALEE